LILNVFSLGDDNSLYDDTGIIQQAIPLQEAANKLERQIIDLNEGQKRVWATSGITEKVATQLVNETGDILVQLQGGNVKEQILEVKSGRPDSVMINNLTHLLNEIDNIIGMHSTTRGESNQAETLGGRKLLKGADMGRLDLIVRNIEQVVEKWYLAYLHMIKVYSEDGEVLRSERDNVEIKPEESEYCWELVETNLGDLLARYPAKKQEIITLVGNSDEKNKVRYHEFWGGNGEWLVCKMGMSMGMMKEKNMDKKKMTMEAIKKRIKK